MWTTCHHFQGTLNVEGKGAGQELPQHEPNNSGEVDIANEAHRPADAITSRSS